jgi:L-arabinose isomerase
MGKYLVETKARIGIMGIALEAYMPQFPGLREAFQKQFDSAVKQYFSDDYYTLYNAGVVTLMEQSEKAGVMFKTNDIDVLFLLTLTYCTSHTLTPAIRDLDIPVVVCSLQAIKSPDTSKVNTIEAWLRDAFASGPVPEMTATMIRMGKRFDVITGYLEDDKIFKGKVEKWCKAALVRARFRQSCAAMIGRQYPGMWDLYTNDANLYNRLGIFVKQFDWECMWRIAEGQNDKNRIHAVAQDILDTFEIEGGKKVEELYDIAAYVCGYEDLVKKEGITIIASHYNGFAQGPAGELDGKLNCIYSMLIKQGVSCAVEGDIKVGTAMSILKTIAGTGTLEELYTLDFGDDIAILGHSGSGDAAISTDRKPLMKVVEVFHGKTGGGYLTQFYPGSGELTILAIGESADGTYKLIAAEGVAEKGPIMNLGDTNQRTRLSIPMREFVDRWSLTGPTHHFGMAKGRHIETLKCVASILNMPIEIVCR